MPAHKIQLIILITEMFKIPQEDICEVAWIAICNTEICPF